MLDMPLDVVLEICSHLLPRDLLHLARTSKALRAFFMSRSSQSMWKSACANVPGLPPCPSDLSEPAYANLVFDAHCHDCMKKNCNHIYPTLRIRLCKSCRESSSLVVRGSYVTIEICNFAVTHVPLSCSPSEVIRNEDYNAYLKQEVLEFIKQLKETPIEGREELLSRKREMVSEISKHAELLLDWLECTKTSRVDELSKLRSSRRKAILEKLHEDGQWEEEFAEMERHSCLEDQFNTLPEVRKPQALTAKVWTNIKGPVTAFMQQIKDKRIAEIRRKPMEDRLRSMREFVKTLPMRIPGFSFSPLDIVIQVPEAQRLIDPDEPTFNPEDLVEPIKNYLEAVARQKREEFRKSILRVCGLNDSGSTDPFSLKLAVGSLFACPSFGCGEPLSLEQAVFHKCYGGYQFEHKKPKNTSQEFFDAASRVNSGDTYNTAMWCRELWYEEGITVMRRIVEACGFDCRTATIDDLDRADVRLRCLCHLHGKGDWRPIMTWRTAMANWAHQRGGAGTSRGCLKWRALQPSH
ncbi:hypothetical protein BC629DRAFT_808024 [Irpex lacteus]|nr:hypothetical protein BC629DRAFT_808024 [Irpex lacteus]